MSFDGVLERLAGRFKEGAGAMRRLMLLLGASGRMFRRWRRAEKDAPEAEGEAGASRGQEQREQQEEQGSATASGEDEEMEASPGPEPGEMEAGAERGEDEVLPEAMQEMETGQGVKGDEGGGLEAAEGAQPGSTTGQAAEEGGSGTEWLQEYERLLSARGELTPGRAEGSGASRPGGVMGGIGAAAVVGAAGDFASYGPAPGKAAAGETEGCRRRCRSCEGRCGRDSRRCWRRNNQPFLADASIRTIRAEGDERCHRQGGHPAPGDDAKVDSAAGGNERAGHRGGAAGDAGLAGLDGADRDRDGAGARLHGDALDVRRGEREGLVERVEGSDELAGLRI